MCIRDSDQPADRLGLAMASLISLLALVIVEFSARYLQGEPGQRRYLLALLGTLAAVALVVVSADLYWLVAAWIASSLCLHQLLTFYRDRPMALVVAHKKFLASRLADVCLIPVSYTHLLGLLQCRCEVLQQLGCPRQCGTHAAVEILIAVRKHIVDLAHGHFQLAYSPGGVVQHLSLIHISGAAAAARTSSGRWLRTAAQSQTGPVPAGR